MRNLEQDLKVSVPMCYDLGVPVEHMVKGVKEADVVVYVAARNDSKSWVAQATGCDFDSGDGSPIAGMVEINVENFNEDMPLEWQISVLRHELAHVLAVSNYYFSWFPMPDNSSPIKNVTLRGEEVTILSTPKVTAKARAAFACPSLQGLELENYGGEGTVGSHWEKRIMANDFMVGMIVEDPIYTDITLAIFEDSGWYHVNYTLSDKVKFGRGQGCKFIEKKCVMHGKTQIMGFCDQDGPACSLYNTRKAWCHVVPHAMELPGQYQYFDDPRLGGVDSYADFCPYPLPFDNGDCRGHDSYATFYSAEVYGEAVCEHCMCFVGDYISTLYSSDILDRHTGCHEVICRGASAYVTIGNTMMQCPHAGGLLSHIPGFSGSITCPAYDQLCGLQPCPNGCFGYGICKAGVCECDQGYFGLDCSFACHSTCLDCSNSENCNSCQPGLTLKGSNCICPANQVFDPHSHICISIALQCNSSCKECFGPSADQCLFCPLNAYLTHDYRCICNGGLYFSKETATCEKCHPSCSTCAEAGAEKCTSCAYEYEQLAGNSVGECKCLSFLYKTESGACLPGHASCWVSKGPEVTDCISCKNATLSDAGVCDCPLGFYSMLGTCYSCSPECTSCDLLGCTGCKAEQAIAVNGICTCPAPLMLNIAGDYCTTCHPHCKSCYGPAASNCLTCQDHAYMKTVGTCECAVGYYLTTAETCEGCNPMCLTCTSSHHCQSCRTLGAVLNYGKCMCGLHKYVSEDYRQCLECDERCDTCMHSGPSGCLSCISPALLQGAGPSHCICPAGFSMTFEGSCGPQCTPSCLICSEAPEVCAVCNTTVSTLVSSHCECNSNAYLSTSECELCDISCAACSGPSPTDCVKCPPLFTLVGSVSGFCSPVEDNTEAINADVPHSQERWKEGGSNMGPQDYITPQVVTSSTTCSALFTPLILAGVTALIGSLLAFLLYRTYISQHQISVCTIERVKATVESEAVDKAAVTQIDAELKDLTARSEPLLESLSGNYLLLGRERKWAGVLALTTALAVDIVTVGGVVGYTGEYMGGSWSEGVSSFSINQAIICVFCSFSGFSIAAFLSLPHWKSISIFPLSLLIQASTLGLVAVLSHSLCAGQSIQWILGLLPAGIAELVLSQGLLAYLHTRISINKA